MKMDALLCLAVVLLSICACASGVHERWSDVYTGRHFNELVLNPVYHGTKVVREAVLVMYSESCADHVARVFQQAGLPDTNYLVMAKHNPEDARKYIWYDLDETDNLELRYQFHDNECAHALVFAPGSDVSEPERMDLAAITPGALWEKLKVPVKIINRCPEDVEVKFYGDGPLMNSVVLPAWGEVDMTVFISYVLAAFSVKDDAFLRGFLLEHTGNISTGMTIEISGSRAKRRFFDWLVEQRRQQKNLAMRFNQNKAQMAVRYISIFKQPVLLPKFTSTSVGYEKRQMPDKVFDILTSFYTGQGRKVNFTEENEVRNVINIDTMHTSMMYLPDKEAEEIGELMLPVVEEWAGCPLKLSYMYGIREYHRGNTLSMHVDRTASHVISVILQVAQDLGEGGEPWFLHVIDFGGKRRNISLEAGEMVLYESATLPHSRPFPLQGRTYANAFLHYMPRQGWSWELGDGLDITDGTIAEPFDTLASERMDNLRSQNWKNYLWEQNSSPTSPIHVEM